MNAPLSENTQAVLLLTAPLIVGRQAGDQPDLLTPGEYNRLARALREKQRQPADLLGPGPDVQALLEDCRHIIAPERATALLARGFSLGQAADHWQTRSIWVASRADPHYPRRLKSKLLENAPVIIYGCGDATLLNNGGLAIVGSRNAGDTVLARAENAGRLAAAAGIGLVSGGARGVDQAAMRGAFQGGGNVLGVLADSLGQAALSRENRDAIRENRAVLISAQDPAAGFNVGNAMQRNKYIYALADAALVVNSDYQKGGTWAGAIEQLEKYHFAPVFVHARARADNGVDEETPASQGNTALLKRGAREWPDPQNAEMLAALLDTTAAEHAAEQKKNQQQQQQDSLPLSFG